VPSASTFAVLALRALVLAVICGLAVVRIVSQSAK